MVSIAPVVLKLQALSDEELERTMTHTFDLAKECIQINYYGAKTTFEYLLPLLQLSDSPRVVNVSSALGKIEVT
jgi:(+)-neomenthol dehydrogenase